MQLTQKCGIKIHQAPVIITTTTRIAMLCVKHYTVTQTELNLWLNLWWSCENVPMGRIDPFCRERDFYL